VDRPRPKAQPGPWPGAGRPKGSLNKRSKALLEGLIAEQKTTPVQAMLDILHQAIADGDAQTALIAAQAVAPYVHPRLQTSAVSVDMDARVQSVVSDQPLTDAEWISQFGAHDEAQH
jgi:hypothetical protein